MQHPKLAYQYMVQKPQIILPKILLGRSMVSEEVVQQVSWAMMNFTLLLEDNVMMQLNMWIFIKTAEINPRSFTSLPLITVISASKMSFGICNQRCLVKFLITCWLWYLMTNKSLYIIHSWSRTQVDSTNPWLIFKHKGLLVFNWHYQILCIP